MRGIKNKRKLGVYLDGAANTPLDPRVEKAMRPYLSGFCGNSNSTHKYGQVADLAVDGARTAISAAIGCLKDEVYFTSGATESNNWVIKGLALVELTKPESERRKRIICLSHEHSSVLASCKSLEPLGFEVELVDPIGDISAFPAFQMAMARKKAPPMLVCCMAVNNETGQIFPSEAIAKYALEIYGSPTLVDCTQALSIGGQDEVRLRYRFPSAAFLTFSGHKLYGPTGVGCLITNGGIADGSFLTIPPLLNGGSQEGGVRGGTVNVAGVVGLAKALDLMAHESCAEHFDELHRQLVDGLGILNSWIARNLQPADSRNSLFLNKNNGVKHIININCGDFVDFPNLADAIALRDVAVSAGAACAVSEDALELSHVLSALKVDERGIRNSVRVSFTKFTTPKDVDTFLSVLKGLITDCYSPRKWEERKAVKTAKKKKTSKQKGA